MRNKTAVPLIVLGVVLMLIGIGLRTVWAPPETATARSAEDTPASALTVLEPEVLQDRSGPVRIKATGEGNLLLAVGRDDDVDAWVADAAVTRLSGDGEALAGERTEGESEVPFPAGSDLWVVEETGEGTVEYAYEPPAEGSWKVLLASESGQAPTAVEVSWDNDSTNPLALPLIVLGALVAVLGAALGFLPGRGSGGRRAADAPAGSRPPREKEEAGTAQRRALRPAAALAALALAAVPAAGASAAEDEQPAAAPVVLDSQLQRILEDVSATVEAADAASDPAALEARVAGAALAMRTASYEVRAKAPDLPAQLPVAAEPVRARLVESTDAGEWPRRLLAVTQAEGQQVPQVLMLVQDSARQNYRLTSAVGMLPGTTFPPVPAAGSGVDAVAADSAEGLGLSPSAAMDAVADALTNPEGANADTFAENTFAEAVTRFQSEVTANPENEFATISFQHTAEQNQTQALRTADGGAVVTGYMLHNYSSSPREAGDSINLRDTVYETLTGEAVTDTGIDVRYGEAVLLYLPPADSGEQAQVIGAAQQLLNAVLK